jgi:hypothetical protein
MAEITNNPELEDVATEARGRLEKALARLET